LSKHADREWTVHELKNFHAEIQRLKKEKRSLQGMINHLSGMMAE